MREPFDFDRIEVWGPDLNSAVEDILPQDTANRIARFDPAYIEDARDRLFELADRDVLVKRVSEWIKQQSVLGYHGTRVTDQELGSIRLDGLLPLVPSSRTTRLKRGLSGHPKWAEVEPSLAEALRLFGNGKYGRREGQVHLTISRAGLTRRFNYYLTQGSEMDWQVAGYLLGQEGQDLISADGVSTLIKLRIPGDIALAACNRHGPLGSELPNLVSDILSVFSYWLVHPKYCSESRELDRGMIFYERIPPNWIEDIIALRLQ